MLYPFTKDYRITSAYGMRTFNGTTAFHAGLDLVCDNPAVVAVCDGLIVSSNLITDRSNLTWQWGNYVCLKSDDDGKLIYHCHLASRAVRYGQHVQKGELLGIMGNTGYSFGAHTHFEVREGSTPINAADYLGIKNEIGYATSNVEESEDDEMAKDDSTPSEWAEADVAWAQAHGIIFGDENGNLKLRDSCTREQMIVFLHRLYKLITEGQT